MSARGWLVGWAALGSLGLASGAEGQLFRFGSGGEASVGNPPAITAIEPAGATVGAETEWTVRGQNLAKVGRWVVSGEGVAIEATERSGDGEAAVRVRVAEGAEPGYRELRALGPDGLSNLALFRVDTLRQVGEVEPNDEPGQAQEVAPGTAVSGVLKAQDLDHYRVEGRRGARVTVEVEAQRIGTPIVPVLTLLGPTGQAVARAMETRGLEHDARLAFTFPEDGPYVVQVRDNLYGGSDSAAYRLRVREDGPFATGQFPLGGPAGATVVVEVSGGNLERPRTKEVTLAGEPGSFVAVGGFDGPGGPVSSPMRLVVGGGSEVMEAGDDAATGSATPLEVGQTANGRIARPGEVDRYAMRVKKGESIGVRVRAAELGSWLDSVVRVVDAEGQELAQNDDAGVNNEAQQPFQPFNNQAAPDPDSRLAFQAREDGEVTVEVADRYGDGGPEYAYRLEVGPSRPDFAVKLLFGDPNLIRRQARFGQQQRAPRLPGANGSLTIRPGSTVALNFVVSGEGAVGKVEVRAEGLPTGVTAAPVEVSPPAFLGANRPLPPTGGALVLKAAANAPAELGRLRIVATSRPTDGEPRTRPAIATILLDAPNVAPAGTPSLPIARELTEIPVWVAGDSRPAELRPGFFGPPRPVPVALKGVANPGVLLQGGRLDLALELEPAAPPARSYALEAATDAPGLDVQTLVTESAAGATPDPNEPAALVRVGADVDAPAGERAVVIRFRSLNGEPVERREAVEVRPPIALKAAEEEVAIAPGRTAVLRVEVVREPGAGDREPVQLALDLPAGVRVSDPAALRVAPGRGTAEVVLALEDGAEAPSAPVAVGIAGTIRMPRGRVRVEAAVRPMLTGPAAEE